MRPAVVLVALAACGGKAAPAPAPAPEEPRFSFGWTPPCRVPVTERQHAHGNDFVWAYAVDVTSRSDGTLVVDLVDIDLREVNGDDATAPEDAEKAAIMEAMLDAYPSMIVDRAGRYLESDGVEQLAEQMIAASPNPSMSRRIHESPAVQATFRRQFGEPWLVWVGHWIDWPIEPGASASSAATTPGPTGDPVPFRVNREHLGVEQAHARLRYRETHDQDALKAMLLPALLGMADMADDPDAFMKLVETTSIDGQVEITFEVETEIATLRPRRALLDKQMEFGFFGRSTSERSTREFVFDWSRAIGCQP